MAVSISDFAAKNPRAVEALEIDLLLEAVYRRSGSDFRGYDRLHVRHRLLGLMQACGLPTVSSLQDKVLHDEVAFEALLLALGRRETAMFEDASQIRALREAVLPLLRSFSHPKIWLAECSAAEDVFSLAILLDEENLYERSRIFVTANNEGLLQEAKEGRISPDRLPEYEENYRRSGGCRSLAPYWRCEDGRAQFAPRLTRNITWSQYDFATDASFNEFQLILCRGVLANFGAALQRRTLDLFRQSLARFGVLGVDAASAAIVDHSMCAAHFKPLPEARGLYHHIG